MAQVKEAAQVSPFPKPLQAAESSSCESESLFSSSDDDPLPVPESESSLSSSVERIEITFTLNINRQRLAPDAVVSELHEQTKTVRRKWKCSEPENLRGQASVWKTLLPVERVSRNSIRDQSDMKESAG